MKITSFNPFIIAKNAEETVATFEALGFEIVHTKVGTKNAEQKDHTSVRMKNADGFHVDIVNSELPQDMTAIRMNVDNFDEASKVLTEKGFKNIEGNFVAKTGSSKAAMMVSPTGFAIVVIEHIKD